MSTAVMILSLFLVTSSVASDNCGGNYRGFQYKLTSPNYPGDYPNNRTCVFNLHGECDRQEFHLYFQDFSLKATKNCEGDYLQIGERHVFCGTVSGLRKFAAGNLTLKFHSDGRDTDKGFKIFVTTVPCDSAKNTFNKGSSRINKPAWVLGKSNPNSYYQRSIRDDKNDSRVNVSNPLDALSLSSNLEMKENPLITSYLFLPPNENKNIDSVTLPGELLPPGPEPAKPFSNNNSPSTTWDKSSSGVIPARNYGEPGFGVVDYDIQVGSPDCTKVKPPIYNGGVLENYDLGNYNSAQDQSFPTGNNKLDSPASVYYDPHLGVINSNGWGYGQGPPIGWGGNSLGWGSGGFPIPPVAAGGNIPNWNSAGIPNLPPNWGGNVMNPGSGECCRLPTARRFSIVSPGFPAGSSNPYSCKYTIAKSSPDVTTLRLTLRFFNLGSDDPYCYNGFLEIDGQRFCGCKTGQSFQVYFADYFPKILTVSYLGYPRNRLAGFLVDVYQESGYPNQDPFGPNPNIYSPPGYFRRQARSDDQNSTAISPSPLDPLYHRVRKRDVGYSYSKPSVSLDLDTRYNNPEIIQGKNQERIFGGSCQSRVLWDWVVASKETVFRNVRCIAPGPYYGFSARSYLPPDNANRTP